MNRNRNHVALAILAEARRAPWNIRRAMVARDFVRQTAWDHKLTTAGLTVALIDDLRAAVKEVLERDILEAMDVGDRAALKSAVGNACEVSWAWGLDVRAADIGMRVLDGELSCNAGWHLAMGTSK